jgi:hypothetical protein
MGAALATAAFGSARWARAHVAAMDVAAVPLPSFPATLPSALPGGPAAPEHLPTRPVTASAPLNATSLPTLREGATSLPSLREARALARMHPSSPAALDAWARAALRAGELREAHRATAAWALHDGTVEPRLVMAEVLDATGRRPEATALLTEWVESHPDAADARAALSRLSSDPVARR